MITISITIDGAAVRPAMRWIGRGVLLLAILVLSGAAGLLLQDGAGSHPRVARAGAAATARQPTTQAVACPLADEDDDPEPTPDRTERPDDCERNESASEACVLELDFSETSRVFGPFTFVREDDDDDPAADQDYYSVYLGDHPSGLDLLVGVRGSGGVQLRATVTDPASGEVLARSTREQVSVDAAQRAGWLVIRVENLAPGDSVGESYTLELERTLPQPPLPMQPTEIVTTADTTDAWLNPSVPDRMENNWRYDYAPTIGIGTVYDLNFVCPERGRCEGGDHDWLRIPVKAGVTYLFATFDLVPGVDTSLAFYRLKAGSEHLGPEHPDKLEHLDFLDNDDFNPGHGFLSMRTWTADADSFLFVEIAPRYGGSLVDTAPSQSGIGGVEATGDTRYRFAAVLMETGLGRQLLERIYTQAEYAPPTPTVAATPTSKLNKPLPSPSPAAQRPATQPVTGTAAMGAQQQVVSGPCASGMGVLRNATAAYLAVPPTEQDVLTTYPEGTEVTLLGECYREYVKIRVIDAEFASATPVWMHTLALRALDSPGGVMESRGEQGNRDAAGEPTATPASTATPAPRPATIAPRPWPTPTEASLPPPVARNLEFHLCSITSPSDPSCDPIRSALRVEVLLALTDEVLAEGWTEQGDLVLNISVPQEQPLAVRIGAVGLRMPITSDAMTIQVPRLVP